VQTPNTKDVIAYTTLPRVIPRIKKFFSTGFGYIAFLMAHVYAMVRLLPAGHPYLASENMGRYGFHHVILAAANNLSFKKENIDQFIIFFALLGGVVLLVLQFVILGYSLLASQAHAFSFFDTPNPNNDVAFTILDYVFGIPDMFCSSFSPPSPATCTLSNPAVVSPYHFALHNLFTYYTTGLLLIGVLIFLYFIIVIIVETAVSGTPFGQRFQNVWVPVRLVVAIGLLVPVTYGLNSGQWVVLYAAKWGSSFATVGWNDFNLAIGQHAAFAGTPGAGTVTGGNPVGERYSLVVIPSQTDISSVIEAMSMVHACAYAYMRRTGAAAGEPLPAFPAPQYHINDDYAAPATNFMIRPYLVKNPTTWMTGAPAFPVPTNANMRQLITSTAAVPYDTAVGFYFGGDIIIRFGEFKMDPGFVGPPGPNDFGVHQKHLGGVKPYCGDIRIPVTDLANIAAPLVYGGSPYMLKFYYDLILNLWFNDVEMKQFARSYVAVNKGEVVELTDVCTPALSGCGSGNGFPPCGPGTGQCQTTPPTSEWKSVKTQQYQLITDNNVRTAWGLYVTNGLTQFMETSIMERGWGGAGIWYNKLAEINGSFMDGVMAKPTLSRYPLVMEQVRTAKLKTDKDVTGLTQYLPSISAKSGVDAPDLRIDEGKAALENVAKPLYDVHKYWNGDQKNQNNEEEVSFGNIFMDAMNLLLGTSGLGSMRGANAHLHPLAQLVAVGKGLVESAVRNMAISSASAFMGGALSAFEQHKGDGAVLTAVSQMFLSTAFIGLTAGFVLFYILPFMPFLYFFFAIASWVKAIFEAMVGVPLWALAHLRIDGEGLPGDAAQNGYFLILEIAIRPILTVFGLIAAITIFGAQVRVLNLIWDLVTSNATGFTDSDMFTATLIDDFEFKRTVVDQFFFTVIYTIICYMLGVASFKLIDTIPDNILRWAGASVSAFGDVNQESVESITRYGSVGGMTIGQQAAGAIQGASSGLGSSLGKLAAGPASGPNPP